MIYAISFLALFDKYLPSSVLTNTTAAAQLGGGVHHRPQLLMPVSVGSTAGPVPVPHHDSMSLVPTPGIAAGLEMMPSLAVSDAWRESAPLPPDTATTLMDKERRKVGKKVKMSFKFSFCGFHRVVRQRIFSLFVNTLLKCFFQRSWK